MPVQASWGERRLELSTVIFDLNGTLTVHGELLDGVAERLRRLRAQMQVLLVSSDTYGTLDAVAEHLGVPARRARDAADKAAVLAEVGAASCVGVGNGNNDLLLLRDAALGIVVVGQEGAAPALFAVADIVCSSAVDALDLLLDPQRIGATLRS
jgi:soluble P-type ATPase